MKLPFVLFLLTYACMACMQADDEIASPINNNPDIKNGLTYLALGDSYTIGQSVSEDQRWPVLFAQSMTTNGKTISKPDIIAKTGWTTANLLSNINFIKPATSYDLVSLLIGVNNQYQGVPVEQFRTEFRTLLQKSILYAGGRSNHVFVLSIPDWGATPAGTGSRERITREIDMFNAVAKAECEKENILFIDITPISRKALLDLSLVAEDRLHYSGKMHQLWVDEAIPLVRSLL
jgi:acyl-CoA thioesterase-1